MKKLLIILLCFLANNAIAQESENIKFFFQDVINFQCIDENSCKVTIRPRYYLLDQENAKVILNVPDSVQYSNFYNDFGIRILRCLYSLIEPRIIDSLLQNRSCNTEFAKENFISYIVKNHDFTIIYNASFSYYYNLEDFHSKENKLLQEKLKITKDSLIRIALEFYTIDKVDTLKKYILSHFCSGGDPFLFDKENYMNLLISSFCIEAMSNKELITNWSKIIGEFEEKLDNGELDGDPAKLKRELDNELKQRMLENGVLEEIVLDYYNSRKDIEIFTITDI